MGVENLQNAIKHKSQLLVVYQARTDEEGMAALVQDERITSRSTLEALVTCFNAYRQGKPQA